MCARRPWSRARGVLSDMSDDKQPPSLEDLGDRVKAARQRRDQDQGSGGQPALPSEKGASAGYRVSVELFAGMLFGGGLGWFLDRELGTKPWLMVVLFLLGSAAGLLNAYRAMTRAAREPSETAQKDEKEGSDRGSRP